MKLNMYAVHNELVNAYSGIYLFRSDAVASVELPVVVARSNPLDESRLYRIGTFDDETCQMSPLAAPVLVEWDKRRLPNDVKE